MRLSHRLAWAGCLLSSFTASAHVVRFQFLSPVGPTSRSLGGSAVVQWLAGPDPTGAAEFSLYASRGGIAPFGVPRADATIDATSRAPVDGILSWDAGALAPGCYQPFAEMDDQIEGTTWRPAEGMITFGPTDGGPRPPAIWVSSAPNQPLGSDGGLELAFDVDAPDEPASVSIWWALPDGGTGVLTTGLGLPADGGSAHFTVAPTALPSGANSFLRLEVRSVTGQSCSAWWGGQLAPAAPVGVPDAGTDGGAPDAGDTKGQPQGCGCTATPEWLALGGLLGWLTGGGSARRRRE